MTSENYLMNSEISSDQEGDQDDESGGNQRSYNCTFCKRGFTNAQALGGHMNIHRKDKAKTKQQQQQQLINMPTSTSSSYRFPTNDESMTFPFLFHEPSPNPIIRNQNLTPAPAPAHAFPYDPRLMNQELGGPNLSLQIGPTTHHVGHTNQIRHVENEVDLELRLGYDP